MHEHSEKDIRLKNHHFHGLVCPLSKEPLVMNEDGNWLYALKSNCAYPINNNIPVMLPSESRPLTDCEVFYLKKY